MEFSFLLVAIIQLFLSHEKEKKEKKNISHQRFNAHRITINSRSQVFRGTSTLDGLKSIEVLFLFFFFFISRY